VETFKENTIKISVNSCSKQVHTVNLDLLDGSYGVMDLLANKYGVTSLIPNFRAVLVNIGPEICTY
jgi:hypothetical protein